MTVDRPSSPTTAPTAPSPDHRAEPSFTSEELVAITRGEVLSLSSRPVRGAAVDSRLIRPGELFVALHGERTDGHRFLGQASAAGAAALLVSEPPPPGALDALGDVTVVRVDDTLAGLWALASAWRRRFDPFVVGVTGSIAKTSTKEAIGAVLSAAMPTLVTSGNKNNEIGLPLTVLSLGAEHRAAVFEMGMYVGGEISDLARIALPRVGVVTAVQAVHLSRIGTLDAIERAKGELVEALPARGVAVLNADDARVRRMADRTTARSILYGFAPDADVRAEEVRSDGLDGMTFTLVFGRRAGAEARLRATIPALGRLSVHNALAAAAVGRVAALDGAAIDDATILRGLHGGWSAPHRGVVHRLADVTIVDDAYNASPGSMTAALDLLAGLPGRRVAVLGEMLELGEETEAAHLAVGASAAATADAIVVVGTGGTPIARGAREAGMAAGRIVEVPDRDAALDALTDLLQPGDVVLVKASRGIELDLLVDALIASLAPKEPRG